MPVIEAGSLRRSKYCDTSVADKGSRDTEAYMNAGPLKTRLALSWLLLMHQLPAQPAYLRVKVWRRLQAMGAVPVKNAVHALPMSEGTQEDFEWLMREIVEGGGEAFLCEARLIDGLSDENVQKLFDEARDEDYKSISKDARALTKLLRAKMKP